MYKTICLLCSWCGVLSEIVATEYGNDEDNMYQPPTEQHLKTPRLEDFFWTGSGDGPPAPAPRPQPSPVDVISVTTVIATVYLDALPPQAVTDQTTGACLRDCEDVAPDGLVPEIPEDRRYWLLTVIQGATPDGLQLKLARLYQKAFLRQQEKHLGIIKSLDAPPSRKKHEVHSFSVRKLSEPDAKAALMSPEIHSSIVPIIMKNASNRVPKIYADGKEMYPADFQQVDNISDKTATDSKEESWILATPVLMGKLALTHSQESLEDMDENKDSLDPLKEVSNETIFIKREILKPEQQPPVHVHIQNVTEESDVGAVQIIYVVLVGGRAVPAAVAARDMRLVRDAEVAVELGAPVNIKAEPYLKEAEGVEGSAVAAGIRGAELWALGGATAVTLLLLLALATLLCMAHNRKKAVKSASSLRVYRDEMIREIERNRLQQVHGEKDGKLISMVSPSRSNRTLNQTRPSSSLLPVFRNNSSASSTTSSGVSEVTTVTAIRRQQKKSHALRMPQKKRVGTTDSLLESAGVDSSDSGQQSVPQTPTSYLSMPSLNSFPRGNIVEPLSRILEPVSISHLDLESPALSPKDRPKTGDAKGASRRQMSSQLVRLGSIDKDPGVIGPLVWDLHIQRVRDASATSSKATSPMKLVPKSGVSRMRQRFNELVDDTFTLFGSAGGSDSHDTYNVDSGDKLGQHKEQAKISEARNDNVRLHGSPLAALEIIRGRSAGPPPGSAESSTRAKSRTGARPMTSAPRSMTSGPWPMERRAPATAWANTTPQSLTHQVPAVNPAIILSTARLQPNDPAASLIADIQAEIKRVRGNAKPPP